MTWVEEFFNKVHSKKDGKFAETPGPGHAKGAPKATPAQARALKSVLSKPKTGKGSVVVSGKPAPSPAPSKPTTKPPKRIVKSMDDLLKMNFENGVPDAYGGVRDGLGQAHGAVPGHKNLSQAAVTGLQTYRSSAHDDINKALRGIKQKYGPRIDAQQTAAAIAGLDEAFHTAPRTTKDMVVYREVGKDVMPPGKPFTDKGFTSTGWSDAGVRNGIDEKKKRVIAITVPKGSKAIVVGNTEEEILLPRNGTFIPTGNGSYRYKEAGD